MSLAPPRLAPVFNLIRLILLTAVPFAAAAAPAPVAVAPAGADQDLASARAVAARVAAEQGLAGLDLPADPQAALIAYARAQHGGRLPPGTFLPDWAIRPAAMDAAHDLAGALAERRLSSWLAALPPTDDRYARLTRAYTRYLAIASRGGWPALASKPTLGPGDSGEAVEALRRRLAIEDPVPASAPAPGASPATASPVYDAALTAAVTRAQDRYGLTADGRAGPATIAALNAPVEARLLQIRANLERWRWAPRTLPAYRVELNTAAATLELRDGGRAAMTMRAIVGRAGKATPMFADNIKAVVFNPPWNVPADIAAREIWPKIRRNPAYMAREGFVVRPGGGLQQRPGPRCALGAVKFDLSNPFGVYLHDTPARSLFALDRRALSHGCMRLESPTDLAKRLLAGDPAWPETAINLALLNGQTVRAQLRTAVPVFVFYWTAFVDDDDHIGFRPDVYRWDEQLAARLRAAGHGL